MKKTIKLGACAYCGVIEELRPYGKDGANICYECGVKPENIATTEAAFDAVLKWENQMAKVTQKN